MTNKLYTDRKAAANLALLQGLVVDGSAYRGLKTLALQTSTDRHEN